VAHYAGDGVFAAANSVPVAMTVLPENSATSVSVFQVNNSWGTEPFPSGQFGTPLFLQAHVSTARVGGVDDSTPSGAVTFADTFNGVTSNIPGSYPLNAAGDAITQTGFYLLAPGNHSVSAAYGGDASFNPGASPTMSVAITRASTEVINDSQSNQTSTTGSFTLTVIVQTNAGFNPLTDSFGGIPTPTGTVTLFNGGTQLGNPVPIPNGTQSGYTANATVQATFQSSQLAPGTNTLTAVYSGDANYAGSTSNPFPMMVLYPTSTTVITSNPDPTEGTSVTFTAQVTSAHQGPAISGEVLFSGLQGNVDLVGLPMSAAVFNGTASVTITVGAGVIGPYVITALYTGDGTYFSSSNTTSIGVPTPDFSIGVSPMSQTISSGQTATYTLSLTAINGFNEQLIINCSGIPQGASCVPMSPTITVSGTSPVQVQLSVMTTPRSSRLPGTGPRSPANLRSLPVFVVATCMLMLLAVRRYRRKPTDFVFCVLLLAVIALGCSGGSGSGGAGISGTPSGTYTLTIAGNPPSGPGGHSTTFSLTVN